MTIDVSFQEFYFSKQIIYWFLFIFVFQFEQIIFFNDFYDFIFSHNFVNLTFESNLLTTSTCDYVAEQYKFKN